MTYSETIEFLYSQLPAFHRIGKAAYKADLVNTLALDEHLNHPHSKFASIHIAGTNGKGSVSHMIASIFQEAGYKTGLYTSPHLRDYRERIKINGEKIPEEHVVSFVEKNFAIINSVKPSFFEMSVALAFDYFTRSGVELAVVEVGLGGRLDSTNIITPLLSLVTNIGHDHMEMLGDTLVKVAGEKAGIIKRNVPVIIGEKQELVKDVFINEASRKSSRLLFAEDVYDCKLHEYKNDSQFRGFSLLNRDNNLKCEGETPLGGDYQVKNIPLVAAAIDNLNKDFKISERNLLDGIKNTVINTGLEGRWQVLGNAPLIICDTGHNKEGMEYVIRQINRCYKESLHMVVGFVNDKDLSKVLPMLPKSARYYFAKASVPRALDEKILKEKASHYGLSGDSFDTVAAAFKKAKAVATEKDMIFIGGSTFVVADLLQQF